MSKELPYFRFTPSEWQNGKISLEDYEIQGFMVQVCCFYWLCDCVLTRTILEKKFKNDLKLINFCIENKIFKYEKKSDFIIISFLNEQFDALSTVRKARQIAGSKGGKQKASKTLAIATNLLKQNPSYKDNNNNNIYIENMLSVSDKKEIFKKEVNNFLTLYDLSLLESFFDYWSEPDKTGKKMRYELEKTWDLSLRLKRWYSNNKNTINGKQETATIIKGW